MARLIDADRMKVVLDKNFGHTSGAIVLANLIDMQPTAYDVEAVAMGLEKLKGDDSECLNGCDGMFCTQCVLDKAIEIVRAGGRPNKENDPFKKWFEEKSAEYQAEQRASEGWFYKGE